MKKNWLLLLIIVLVMLFAGCGESGKTNKEVIVEKVSLPTINSGSVIADYMEINIICAEQNVIIVYTVDGSVPTEKNGTIYEKPFSINKTTTIKAKAFKTGMTESDIAEKTVTITPKPTEIMIQSISVKALPAKINYYVGETTLDITGLVVEGTYSDSSKKNEIVPVSNITGFDTKTAGTKSLTITYNGKTATFNITVIAVSLQSISIKTAPVKVNYYIGDTKLDITGLVVNGIYSDSTVREVKIETANITGFDTTIVGTKNLTIKYNGKTTTFNITVNDEIIKGAFTLFKYVDFLKINEYKAEFEVLDSTVTKILFSGTSSIRPKEVIITNKKATVANFKVDSSVTEIILTAVDSNGKQVGNSKVVKLK